MSECTGIAVDLAQYGDQYAEAMLYAVQAAINGSDYSFTFENGQTISASGGKVYFPGFDDGVDPMSGAGAMIIDRMNFEISTVSSISASTLAALQRTVKEINSKLA